MTKDTLELKYGTYRTVDESTRVGTRVFVWPTYREGDLLGTPFATKTTSKVHIREEANWNDPDYGRLIVYVSHPPERPFFAAMVTIDESTSIASKATQDAIIEAVRTVGRLEAELQAAENALEEARRHELKLRLNALKDASSSKNKGGKKKSAKVENV